MIDQTENEYGDLLLDLLIDSNMCMLNGRLGENNFTCVSTMRDGMDVMLFQAIVRGL